MAQQRTQPLCVVTDEDGTVSLIHKRHNLGRLAKTLQLNWDANGLLTRADDTESAPRDSDQLRADADAVLDALKAAHTAGVNVPAVRLGAFTGRHALAACGLPAALSDKAGTRRFWAAVDFLLAEKCAEREKYTTDQRKKRDRIVPREGAPNGCAPLSL